MWDFYLKKPSPSFEEREKYQKENAKRFKKEEEHQRKVNPHYDSELKASMLEASKRNRERMEADNKLKAQRASETRRLNKLHGHGTHGVKAGIQASKERRAKAMEEYHKSRAIKKVLSEHK